MAKKQDTKPAEPVVLDAAPDTTTLVAEDTNIIRAFFSGTVAFFAKAATLERDAKERLDIANQMKAKFATTPITRADDEQLQIDIKASRAKRAEIDGHWQITVIASRFHKRLVGGRERSGLMVDEAVEIEQQLHNSYVRDEERKAREEENRRRAAAEEQAARDREAEALRLDEEASRSELAAATLSEREHAFCDYQLSRGMSPFEAAKAVGYKAAAAMADKLMASPKILAALDEKKRAIIAREQAAAVRSKPLNASYERVRPNVTKVAGTRDSKRWKATVYDAEAFLAAVLDPRTRLQHGIPTDVVTFVQPKLNELARALQEKMNTWPGVRAEEDRSTS